MHMSQNQLDYNVDKLRIMIRNASFQKALQFLQNQLMDNTGYMKENEVLFYNECLVYVFYKLKEY